MLGKDARVGRRFLTFRDAVRAHVHSERVYDNYPIYASLLAVAVWLFGRLPQLTPVDLELRSPGLFLLFATAVVSGSVLAFALGMVGMWRPGRASLVLSLLAMLIPCLP